MNLLYMLYLVSSTLQVDPDMKLIRLLYIDATTEKDNAVKLLAMTSDHDEKIIVQAYHGAGMMVMARYYFNPLTKWKSFSQGRALLESAIQSEPMDAELRYLRLSIQEHAPAFLGYHQSIEADKAFLNNNLGRMEDEELRNTIASYLQSGK